MTQISIEKVDGQRINNIREKALENRANIER